MKNKRVLVALLLILTGSILLSLNIGSSSEFDEQIFWLLRFPRVLSAIAIGGGLAVSGAVLQSVLQNPLADPFTIGISSAGVFGAILGSLIHISPFWGATSLAFLFSFSMLAGLALWMKKRIRLINEVLLVGVLIGFFFSALSTLTLAVSDPATWTTALSWIYGALGKLSLSQSIVVLFANLAISAFIWLHSQQLDLIAVGEWSAESVGLRSETIRLRIFLLVSLMTAICVAMAGIIGFVGLIVPHLVRKLGLRLHQNLIVGSFLLGSSLLCVADLFSRLVLRPSELPVGVVLAIFGAPFLIFLTRR